MSNERVWERLAELIEESGGKDTIFIKLATDNHLARQIIISEANSKRQAQGLADLVSQFCREMGEKILGKEGYENGEWILVDCNETIVHIMRSESRELYRLEDLSKDFLFKKDIKK